MKPKIKTILKELKNYLKDRYGDRLSQLILYGSQARGEAEPGSDIDLLVVLKGDIDPFNESNEILDQLVQWNLDYNELVSCLFMDEDRFQTQRGPLLRNIHREGIIL